MIRKPIRTCQRQFRDFVKLYENGEVNLSHAETLISSYFKYHLECITVLAQNKPLNHDEEVAFNELKANINKYRLMILEEINQVHEV